MARGDKALPMLVMGMFLTGGYLYWQGRHRFDPLSKEFDFEKHQSTRHLVDMQKRVDKAALQAWLDKEEGERKSST